MVGITNLRAFCAYAALAGVAGIQPAFGQASDEDSAPTEAEAHLIGAVAVDGAESLLPADFAPIVEPYIGRALDREELTRLATEVADLARSRGFPVAEARIDAQAIRAGVLRVTVDPGRIDEVQITGDSPGAAEAILRALEGRVARSDEFERALVLVERLPGVRVRSKDIRRKAGRTIVRVRLLQQDVKLSARLDNHGSESLGPWRAGFSAEANGVLASSDQLGAALRTNPERPGELLFGSGWYSAALGGRGTRATVAGSIGATEPDGALRDFDYRGKTRFASGGITTPLALSARRQLDANVGVAYLKLDQLLLDVVVQSDTIVTMNAGIEGRMIVGGGVFGLDARVTQGLGWFGATRAGDFLASRIDADGQGTRFNLDLRWRVPLSAKLLLKLDARGQLAAGPLLVPEELNIGGPSSVRGYDFSEASGEDGAVGLVELSYEALAGGRNWLRFVEPYAFIDGATVHDRNRGGQGGSLASAGGGLRAGVGPFELELEAAQPLTGARRRTGSDAPQLNVQIGLDL